MHGDAHYLDCCLVAWLPASHLLFICFVHIFFFFGLFHLIGKKNFLLIFRHTWTSALKRNNTQSVRIVAWLWSSFCMCSMFNHLFGCVCGNRWRQNMKNPPTTLLIRTKCKFTFTEALMHERLQKNVCHSIQRPNGFKSTEQNEMFKRLGRETQTKREDITQMRHKTSRTNQVGLNNRNEKNRLHSTFEMK